MRDHNKNDDNDFFNDVLNANDDDHDEDDDKYDVDVPYGIDVDDDDDDDNIGVHDYDTCHNTFGYYKTWYIGVNNR